MIYERMGEYKERILLYNGFMKAKNFQYCLLALFISLGLFFFSCSRTEPRIPFGFIDLIYYPGEQMPQERFSFFVIAEDDDGIENLSELRLYHDREGLEWIINSEDWVHYENEEKHWVGSRAIAMFENETLPRGQYRAVLYNKGGEKSERLFTFDTPVNPRFPFPTLQIEGGYYRTDSKYPANSFIVYDLQGNILRTIPVPVAEGNTADLRLPSNARFMALWAQDERFQTSALTDVVSLR